MVLGLVDKHGDDGLGDHIVQVLADHVEVGGNQVLDDHDLHLGSWRALTELQVAFTARPQGERDARELHRLDVALDVLVDFVVLVVAELSVLQLLQSACFLLLTLDLDLLDSVGPATPEPAREQSLLGFAGSLLLQIE